MTFLIEGLKDLRSITIYHISPFPPYLQTLDIIFHQIKTLIKVHVAFVFGLQTLQLKRLETKNKGHMNF